jgi:hypothetical protein
VQASDYATIGTPDANGLPARSTGFVRLTAVAGNPATPEDEADVKLSGTFNDVLDPRRGLIPYAGELQVVLQIRATDRQNGTSNTDAATIRDFRLKFTMPCLAAGDGGTTCGASTTADAAAPGLVVEGKRANWELGSVNLYDGGDDGLVSTAPNDLFATQGVFVP